MAELRTDYVDDVLEISKNTIRKYKQIQNSDGTVSFVDVTEYLTVGTEFGAKDINDITKANNDLSEQINESLTASDNLRFRFATDGEGNYGYLGADDSFIPFNSSYKAQLLWRNNNPTSIFNAQTVTFKDNKYSHYVIKIQTRNDINIVPTIVLVEANKTVTNYYGGGFFYTPGNTSITRIITKTTSNSITFGNTHINNTTNNNYAIPIEIYGVNIIF